jgi:Pyruvate/2-oxoacid:ferredoxin oxidoreductase delta subunit
MIARIKITEWITGFGVLLCLSPLAVHVAFSPALLHIGYLVIIAGTLMFSSIRYRRGGDGFEYSGTFHHDISSRKTSAYLLAVMLTGFYILIYWFPGLLENLVRAHDPMSAYLRGRPADQWFLYGTFYSEAVLTMGIRALFKYRSSNYHVYRTISVIFFQLILAWLIPGILQKFQQPEFYFSYFWPLKYDYLFPGTVEYLTSQPGRLGIFMVFWGAVMSFLATPVLTYFYGKRWYCSWVCGCGGLAETAGDPFRHLSSPSIKSWKLERMIIYPILGVIVLLTIILWINSIKGGALLGAISDKASQYYGFFIGSLFSGVIGVGFYPLLGTRVWCRFGCPMAAVLGIQQKLFSRFRITTNGAQCISCGNCTTYCEMGIDVKSYAQKGENIIRASCVGCGICASVCPRGVLKLENKSTTNRYNEPLIPGNSGWKIG